MNTHPIGSEGFGKTDELLTLESRCGVDWFFGFNEAFQRPKQV